MKREYIKYICIVVLLLGGCSQENPKTKNDRLLNKKITWSGGHAASYEFLADGSFIPVGGDFPLEGYRGGNWESVKEDGSFKIIPDAAKPEEYFMASMKIPMAKGASFGFEVYSKEKEEVAIETNYTVTSYEDLRSTHASTAVKSEATAIITRYADNVYVLDLVTEDEDGRIKKIFTEGDLITTEVMVTNGEKWINNPPIILPKGWNSNDLIRSSMIILYHNGDSEKATFRTSGYRDRSNQVFKDEWF